MNYFRGWKKIETSMNKRVAKINKYKNNRGGYNNICINIRYEQSKWKCTAVYELLLFIITVSL